MSESGVATESLLRTLAPALRELEKRLAVDADANIRKFMDEKALAQTFDLQRQLRAVDAIFKRVFGSESSAPGAKSTSAH